MNELGKLEEKLNHCGISLYGVDGANRTVGEVFNDVCYAWDALSNSDKKVIADAFSGVMLKSEG